MFFGDDSESTEVTALPLAAPVIGALPLRDSEEADPPCREDQLLSCERQKWQEASLIRPSVIREKRRGKVFRSSTKLQMDIKSTKYYIYWLFCQFELITCSYLMEPWEKLLFYTFNITMLATLLYTAYAFVPGHICSAFQFFLHLFGNQHENTVSIVK